MAALWDKKICFLQVFFLSICPFLPVFGASILNLISKPDHAFSFIFDVKSYVNSGALFVLSASMQAAILWTCLNNTEKPFMRLNMGVSILCFLILTLIISSLRSAGQSSIENIGVGFLYFEVIFYAWSNIHSVFNLVLNMAQPKSPDQTTQEGAAEMIRRASEI